MKNSKKKVLSILVIVILATFIVNKLTSNYNKTIFLSNVFLPITVEHNGDYYFKDMDTKENKNKYQFYFRQDIAYRLFMYQNRNDIKEVNKRNEVLVKYIKECKTPFNTKIYFYYKDDPNAKKIKGVYKKNNICYF